MGDGRKKRIKKLIEEVRGKTQSLFSFHVTDREGYALVEHSFTPQVAPQNHNDQARLFELYEKLHLQETWELLRQNLKLQRPLGIDDFDPNKYEIAEDVSVDVIDYVLAITDKQMNQLHALILTPLIKRLKDVKMGAYKLPPAPEEEEEDKEPPVDDGAAH